MPTIDPVAKKWELDLAERVGRAVSARRKSLGLTAVQVADRAAALGWPISRQAVAKIENNNRAGKLDVAELIVLAAALEISPLQLLYPDLVDGPVEVYPGLEVTSLRAADWFTGNELLGDVTYPDSLQKMITDDYFAGTVPLIRACSVGKARIVVRQLLDTPPAPWRETGPEVLRKAMADLQRAKVNARHERLIVEDDQDG